MAAQASGRQVRFVAVLAAAVLVAGLAGLAVPVGAAHGPTFTVNSFADAPDDDPGDGVCATAGGQCTLRAAVMEANAHEGHATIVVPAGEYTLTVAGDDPSFEDFLNEADPDDAAAMHPVTWAAAGDLDVIQPLTIQGAGSGGSGTRIVASFDGSAPGRLFDVHATMPADVDAWRTDWRDNNKAGLTCSTTPGVGEQGIIPVSFTLSGVQLRDGQAHNDDGHAIDNFGPLVGGGAIAFHGTAKPSEGNTQHVCAANDAGAALTVSSSLLADNEAAAGGAIDVTRAAVTLSNVTFTGNTAFGWPTNTGPRLIGAGGAVKVSGGSVLTATDVVMTGNVVDNPGEPWDRGLGGGLAAVGQSHVAWSGGTVEGNRSYGTGGGIGLAGSSITLTGVEVVDNRAGYDTDGLVVEVADNNGIAAGRGGGLMAAGFPGTDGVVVSGGRFEGNAASLNGGGLFVVGGFQESDGGLEGEVEHHLQLDGVTVHANRAGFDEDGAGAALEYPACAANENCNLGSGGGIYSKLVQLTATTISGNVAAVWGGGLFCDPDHLTGGDLAGSGLSPCDLRMVNTTVSGNSAGDAGGGVYVAGGSADLEHVTVAANEADDAAGGGLLFARLFAGHGFTAPNTLVAQNSPDNCSGELLDPPASAIADDGTCNGFTEVGNAEIAALASNAGTTWTHALASSSPARDAAVGCPPPDVDQRGRSRPHGEACDVGAFEFHPPPPPPSSPSDPSGPAPAPLPSVEEEAAAGGTVSTLPEGGQVNPDQPVAASVTTPNAGTVSITVDYDAEDGQDGFTMLGVSVDITAPPASPEDPLVLGLHLDESLLDGVDPMTVTPLRDGVPVVDCDDPAGTSAAPDPCVESRTVDADGDLVIVVRTSQASLWTFGVADAPPPGFDADCAANDFSDVDRGNVHVTAIDCAAFLDIARGFEDGAYRPALGVRRDQMASFIVRTLDAGGHALPDGAPGFTDVDGNVHAEAIGKLRAAGIVEGVGGARYAPERIVSRAQMASFLTRALDWAGVHVPDSQGGYFTDVDGNTHEAAINAAFELGLTIGRTATTYDPAGDVRRDQMASFLIRMHDHL